MLLVITSSQNSARRGAGLDNLVRQTVLALGRRMAVRSACCLLSRDKTVIDGVAIPHRVPVPTSKYPGTLFRIDLPTDRIDGAEQLDLAW